ncbi:MAG: hypothetical protein Q9212_002521 [Teloschistes hypoglaucus]
MSNEEEKKPDDAKPAMDLQFTRVFGQDGPTHLIRLTNSQYHDLVTQYVFISNRRFQYLSCAGRLQTYLDRLGARTRALAGPWMMRAFTDGGEDAKWLDIFVQNVGGLVGKFREIGLRLQEIGMRIDDEIVWAGLA